MTLLSDVITRLVDKLDELKELLEEIRDNTAA